MRSFLILLAVLQCHSVLSWQLPTLNNPCSWSFCQNNSTCTVNSNQTILNLFNSFTCTCSSGYIGTFCQYNSDPCAYSICLNNGTCSTTSSNMADSWGLTMGNYTCQCPSGYTGEHCGIPVNPCSNNPCRNNGSCTVLTNGNYTNLGTFQCSCPSGYIGSMCQWSSDPCNTVSNLIGISASLCMNGGTCVASGNNTLLVYDVRGVSVEAIRPAGFTCQCASGYSGRFCQYRTSGRK